MDRLNNRTLHIDALRPKNASDPGNIVRYTYHCVNRLVSTMRPLTDDGADAEDHIAREVSTKTGKSDRWTHQAVARILKRTG